MLIKKISSSILVFIIAILGMFVMSSPVFADPPSTTPPATSTPPTTSTGASGGLNGGLNTVQSAANPNNLTFTSVITTIINVVLFLVGIISVVMIIYGGVKYSTSAGDPSKATAAKNTIMYAIVGLIVAILAFAIVRFVTTSVTSTSATPTTPTLAPSDDD